MNRPSSPGGVEPGRSSVVSALGTLGESGPLSPEQKQFKKLISKIEAARQELSQWLTFVPTYQQRYRVEMVPILSRLREKRIAMARLFDHSISDKSLGKRQKAKVIAIPVEEFHQCCIVGFVEEFRHQLDQNIDDLRLLSLA